MFSPGHAGANAYARVGVETGVMGANPHRLVVMLYQGARQAIAQARMHLQQGGVAAVAARGEAISKAIRIIESGLQASLNVEAGGEIGERLNALYSYMARRRCWSRSTACWPRSKKRGSGLPRRSRGWRYSRPRKV